MFGLRKCRKRKKNSEKKSDTAHAYLREHESVAKKKVGSQKSNCRNEPNPIRNGFYFFILTSYF